MFRDLKEHIIITKRKMDVIKKEPNRMTRAVKYNFSNEKNLLHGLNR